MEFLRRHLRRLSSYQWANIDRQYDPLWGPDHRLMWVLLVAALVMVLNFYYSKSKFVLGIPGFTQAVADLPYPSLYAKLYFCFSKLVTYLLVPVIAIKVLFGDAIRDYGLRFEKNPRILLLYLSLYFLVFVPVLIASSNPAFLAKYPLYKEAGQSLLQLLVWELAYGLQFFLLEFFFRGFLLFALVRYFGHGAIFVMVIPYTMIHFGKPMAESLSAIIAGVALGTLALRTGSIWGGVFIHSAIGWSMDLLALYHKGLLQKLY